MLQIHLLGQPRFMVDGSPFKFAAPRKALALLAYLLLNRRAAIARDSVAFLLWSEDTEEEARTELRRHLNYLKNAMPPAPELPWISADGETVQWNPAAEAWFDVAEFERQAALPAERERAVELYGGDLLENLYEDWLFPERERLRALLIDCLHGLLLESRSRRDFAKAVVYAQRIMSVDPWREDVLRQVMAVRYEGGDRAGALREYDQFARRLREEMDVAPMPDTTALRDAIARNAPAAEVQAPGESASQDERATAPLLPLVGRQREMDQLRALWNRAAHGRGGAALISGEAGIGKSRLASELALTVGAQGGRVLVGATLHPESAPYQPVTDALRSASPLLAALDIQPMWLSAVAQIVPDVRARRADLPPLAGLDPSRERIRLFEAIAAALQGLARPRPVLVVLEDLQWAGEATISAIEFLARRAAGQPVLIVGTYRNEETQPGQPLRDLRRRLQRENLVGHIDLARLPESAVKDLFARIPELAGRGDATAASAYAESEGNPLFLGEVIRGLVESSEEPAAARGLRALIQSRVARLSERARFVAQSAAVVGAVFDVDTVSEISGWPESETLEAVEELVAHHVVRETGRRAAFDYAFTHHLVQAAIYETIEAEARARWHRRAARAVTSIYADLGDRIAPVVAHHLDEAGDAGAAAHEYLRAARNARSVFADEEALGHAARGLELSSDVELTYELLALQESLYNRLGRRDEQRAVLDRLEQSARASGVAERVADVLSRRIALHRMLADVEDELRWIEALESTARDAGLDPWMARAALARGRHEVRVGKLAEAEAAFAVAMRLAAKTSDVGIETEVMCELAYSGTLQGRTSEGSAAMAKAEAAAQASNSQALLAHALYSASTASILREDFAQAHELAERAMELYRSVGDREGEADCCARLAMASARRLLVDPATEWYDKARALYGELGKRRGQASVLLNTGVLFFLVGLLDESIEKSLGAEQIFVDVDDHLGIALCTLNKGIAMYYRGEFAEAKALAQRAVELTGQLGSVRAKAAALGNLGAVERELGELDASIEHLREALDLREQIGSGPDGALDLAELALTYAKSGDKAEARELADRLMALDERSYEMAATPQIVPWAAAHAYRSVGQRKRAKEAQERWRVLASKRIAAMPERVRGAYARLPFNRDL
jgi:DNA-binding SARP family transcriptional activator/tetratricopeptide (TPR) repeat protein